MSINSIENVTRYSSELDKMFEQKRVRVIVSGTYM